MTQQLPLPCRHHWRISEPCGEFSPGYCVNCGAEKLFSNVDFADRERTPGTTNTMPRISYKPVQRT